MMLLLLFTIAAVTLHGVASDVAITQTQIQDLFTRIEKLESANVALRHQNTHLSTELNDVRQRLQAQEIASAQQSSAPVVFMAGALDVNIYAVGDIIQFPRILTGSSAHFDNVTSVFTCPYHAIYAFNVALSTTVGYTIYGSLQQAFASGADTEKHGITVCNNVYEDICQSSHTSVVECNPGDTVYVQVVGEVNNQHVHDNVNHYSSFSGYLLYILN